MDAFVGGLDDDAELCTVFIQRKVNVLVWLTLRSRAYEAILDLRSEWYYCWFDGWGKYDAQLDASCYNSQSAQSDHISNLQHNFRNIGPCIRYLQ